MAKKAGGSASSATRKKHAAKAAKSSGPNDDDSPSTPSGAAKANQPPQRGQKKTKRDRFAPKIKSYIPPPAPPKGAPDPVDLYLSGGAGVDPELVVVLRRLAKRDEATLIKGVEGLESWIRGLIKEEQQLARMSQEEKDEEGWKVEQHREQLVTALAVWVSSVTIRLFNLQWKLTSLDRVRRWPRLTTSPGCPSTLRAGSG